MTELLRDRLRDIRTFPSLVRFLRDELDWPIDSTQDFEDLTFEYTPEELGIDEASAAKIEEIKRLRPLAHNQPWGVFFVKFEPKQLPVVALRRILNRVVVKKRATDNAAEQQKWATDDLLFISAYGADTERRISFAHFSQDPAATDLPTLKVLAWDEQDTGLHLDDVARRLIESLSWPAEEDEWDDETWRDRWRSAFELRHREVVTTSKALAIQLAGLARAVRARINSVLDIESEHGPVTALMNAFREALVHDLEPDDFADMYAQTIAYGLLSARILNPSGAHASGERLPVTNPFLKELMETFLHVGGAESGSRDGIDFDELGVTDVIQLLEDAKMEAVILDFGDRNPLEDPVIHFYELFLNEYDAKKRMQRGVFYTPRPVVSYIVRSVHELLKTEFGLEDGLADTSTWGDLAARMGVEIPDGVAERDRFVTVLDPATGTGTFLVEAVDIIHRTLVDKWAREGRSEAEIGDRWNQYVPSHLLPRLHGYELLMAPYAIAHLKIGLKLYETGYRFDSKERARVYLTNALEPPSDHGQIVLEGLLPALAHEAVAVDEIKRRQRFTVVIGNPPYAQYSMNLGAHAKRHIQPFRYANGSRIKARNALQLERNLNDDYVKFLGFAYGLLAARSGLIAMITNRMFLDSSSLVGARESFATSFDEVWIVDLRGSSEESRRVSRLANDQNVFDILQGVAISLYVRKDGQAPRRRVRWREVIGRREHKYSLLASDLDVQDADGWQESSAASPDWWFSPWDSSEVDTSAIGFPIDQVFPAYSTLIASNRDHLVVDVDQSELVARIETVRDFSGTNAEFCEHFGITAKKNWNISTARGRLAGVEDVESYVQPIEYRALDRRWIFFHPSLVWQMAPKVSHNVNRGANYVLISLGKNRAETTNGQWIATSLADKSVVTTRDNASGFPLYLYDDDSASALPGVESPRVTNLAPKFLEALGNALALSLDADMLPSGVTPEDILHYCYALLQSPSYRKRHHAQLHQGFPPIILPGSKSLFNELARVGQEIASVHLMSTLRLDDSIARYVGPEQPSVSGVAWSNDVVWLDDRAAGVLSDEESDIGRFVGVPGEVWEFRVGAYQMCQKWLKDRRGRRLSSADIAHYQEIVVAIAETTRLMAEIDEVIEEHGGWPDAFVLSESAGDA